MFLTTDANNATLPTPVFESTPLIFFPPELAYQISVTTYIHIGCLAVILWDVIDNLKGDFDLLFRKTFKFPVAIYFITRITLLAYMLCRAVLLTLPVADCAKMYDAINALLVVFVSATTAMFYVRVCAVYNKSKIIIVAYGILWLSVVGMLLTIPFTFTAVHIATTQYCGESMHGDLLGPTTVILMVNDTMVYAAIAYKIFAMFVPTDAPRGTKLTTLLTFGKTLPLVSRALLKDSQLYFMVVIVTNPFIVACVYVFEAPISVMFLVCHLVLVNVLSCRVYRNMRMGGVPDVAMPPVINLSAPGGLLAGSRTAGTAGSAHGHAYSRYGGTDSAASDPTVCPEVPLTKVSVRTSCSDDSLNYAEGLNRKGSFVDVEKAHGQRVL
ncbi:hypothetical protein HYPSUDRAFT_202618 [Hypholoma sublateritium FD-334 SS-4]|uniref:G-protein coupled receptors family 1 profile domain-containing protein n=1 Tax=Hypholoma sublateritium (strain FD-334 SS-4) TaxID=945553 RepID=A0A0D2MEB8_HYPSF|nr:hypothetical protein HYPSUDRAFT_202618 [Hypholoma sublateritium FD-334 SS-4]